MIEVCVYIITGCIFVFVMGVLTGGKEAFEKQVDGRGGQVVAWAIVGWPFALLLVLMISDSLKDRHSGSARQQEGQ